MVEAATDPLPPESWFDPTSTASGGPIGGIGDIFTQGEVADRCEDEASTPFTDSQGVSLAVSPYWSNHDHRCVSLDVTAPATTSTLAPPQSSGWDRSTVSVTLSATDDDSGVASVHFSASGAQTIGATDVTAASANLSVSAEGVTLVSFHSVDNAGNVEFSHTTPVRIDLTPPNITGSRVPAPNAAGWSATPVTVAFACSDTLSGIASCSPTTTVSTEGTNQSVAGAASDVAGNQASRTLGGIDIDLTPPIISGVALPPANVNGWNDTDVTVQFTCTDAVSGVASCAAPVPLTSEGIGEQGRGTSVDLAGNSASATVAGVNIDKTPPTVMYTGSSGTYTIDQQVSIACSATDALSGIDSSTCADVSGPAYSFGLGAHVDSASAADRAGNRASTSVQFDVIVTFDSLCNLTGQFLTKAALENAFCAKLQAASQAGKAKSRDNQLGAFKNQVEAQTGKALTSFQATVLEALADALK